MDLECIVCKQVFLPQLFPPFSACPNMHFACIFCYTALLKHSQQGKCPECRTIIHKKSIRLFQTYKTCDLMLQFKRKSYSRQLRQLKKSIIETVSNLIEFGMDFQGIPLRRIARQASIMLIEQNESQSAELLLRRLIELFPSPNYNEKLFGLGLNDDIKGYSEIEYSKWQQYYLKQNICLQDMLSMCYLRQDVDYEQKRQWYVQMHNRFPQNQRILFGLGATLLNRQQFQQSLVVFDKIIQQSPLFIKAYSCKLYIIIRLNPDKEDSQLNQEQSILRAIKTYRNSIFARNLCNIAVKEKNLERKIEILKNCIMMAPDYPDPQVYLGLQRYLQGLIQVSAHHLIRAITSRRVSRQQLSICYQQIGRIYLHYRQYYLTLYFVNQAQLHARTFLPIVVYQKIQTLYYMQRNDQASQQGTKAIIYMRNRMEDTKIPKVKIRHKNNIDKFYQLMITNHQQQKQIQKAIELLKQWNELNNGSECPLYNKLIDKRIQILERKQNEEEYLQWCRRCIQKHYRVEFARKKVKMILQNRGQFQQALDEFVRNYY